MNTQTSRRVLANGLMHHVHEWACADAGPDSANGTVVLIHGYMDAGGTWDLVAPGLAAAGFRVIAPDMRGFGEAPHLSPGAYYHFADYIADLSGLLDALCPVQTTPRQSRGRAVPSEAVFLVGHSMGGTIASLFAGAFPERVRALALLEGVGPENNPHDVAPDRMRLWIEQVDATRERGSGPSAKRVESQGREDALRRLLMNHPNLPRELLETRLPHLARELPDGRVQWKYDPLHKTRSPAPFFSATYRAFARRISCPVLFVSGGARGYHPADEAERLADFKSLTRAEIPDAGHMVHWTEPNRVRELLSDFFRAIADCSSGQT